MRPDIRYVTNLLGHPQLMRQRDLDALLNVLMPGVGAAFNNPAQALALMDEWDEGEVEYREYYKFAKGIAIVPIVGSLVRRSSWYDWYCDRMSYDGLLSCLREAFADPEVKAVLLEIDSPGGEANGCFDFALEIRALADRFKKPLWSIANECMCSAAYAAGCVADEVWVARTAEVGSIGVVCAHVDQSALDAKVGLKWTYISKGENKTRGNPHEPLSEEAISAADEDMGVLYEMFVDVVSQHRGMTADAVRATKADTYRGQAAVEAKLATRVGTFNQAFAALVRHVDNQSTQAVGNSNLNTRSQAWPVARSQSRRAAASKPKSPPMKSSRTKTSAPKTTTRTRKPKKKIRT